MVTGLITPQNRAPVPQRKYSTELCAVLSLSKVLFARAEERGKRLFLAQAGSGWPGVAIGRIEGQALTGPSRKDTRLSSKASLMHW